MGGRIIGSVERIIAELGIQGGRISKALNRQIETEANAIATIARQMVPRDFGHMESAIRVTSKSQRRIWTVFVDDDVPADGPKRGVLSGRYTVGDYLAFLHEGFYTLGAKSQAKDNNTPYRVGRKFLERAFEERFRRGLKGRLTAAARRAGSL
jgi:hypothetical protein